VRRDGVKQRDEGCQHFCTTVLILFGAFLMNSLPASGGQTAEPLRGPDFVLEKVASWVERPGADGELQLQDGSLWKVSAGTKLYSNYRDVIGRAQQNDRELFLSGDKNRGFVEIVVDARYLAVQEISDKEEHGRYGVLFQGPPSVYYLHMNRPWSQQALALLRRSATSGASFSNPDLVVAIDPAHSEIVAVKPIQSSKAGTLR
jgi:hypothetical protein